MPAKCRKQTRPQMVYPRPRTKLSGADYDCVGPAAVSPTLIQARRSRTSAMPARISTMRASEAPPLWQIISKKTLCSVVPVGTSNFNAGGHQVPLCAIACSRVTAIGSCSGPDFHLARKCRTVASRTIGGRLRRARLNDAVPAAPVGEHLHVLGPVSNPFQSFPSV